MTGFEGGLEEIRLTTQAIKPVEALKLYNQLKTVPAVPVLVPMNANRPRLAVKAVA
jgi:hypothetical protein